MRARLLIAVFPGMVIAAATELPAQDRQRPGDQKSQTQADARQKLADSTVTIASGFFFYDGQYVPLPYRVQESDDGVTINGHLVARRRLRRQWGGRGRFGGPGFGRPGFAGRGPSSTTYVDHLKSNAVVIAAPESMTIVLREDVLSIDLFRCLLNRQRTTEDVELLFGNLPPFYNTRKMRAWVQDFQPPVDLTVRMQKIVDAADEEANRKKAIREEKRAAEVRLEKLTYPLTMLGMVLSVFALGHLLMSRPKVGGAQTDQAPSPELIRAAMISLGLVAGLSALDLTWTILASQAGQMKEINPVGQQLISDPTMLAIFKVSATGLGCGLLLFLRRYSTARMASWWLCLVLTLVTFRWLIFNSMMTA